MRWLFVLTCACNQVYAIDETNGPDSDRDAVLDGTDNCTLAANRGQEDDDGDGLGDACDPCIDGPQSGLDGDGDGVDDACDACLTGPDTDEDGDEVLDGCDVCPGDPDDQTDRDGDGVGDACDHAPAVTNARVFFDGFGPARAGWKTGFQVWDANDGAFVPASPVILRWRAAWHPATQVPPTSWTMRAEIEVPSLITAPVSQGPGVEAITVNGGVENRVCGLFRASSGWVLRQSGTPITVGPRIRVELRDVATATECYIDGVLVSSAPHGSQTVTLASILNASDSGYRWIDVIR